MLRQGKHCVTIVYISLVIPHKTMTRGSVIEDGGRANVYAIEPQMYVDETQQFGFNEYAEKLNGRLAMIGFISAMVLEVLTGHGLIGWLTSL
jgi:Chlorophyll A-B binding protein